MASFCCVDASAVEVFGVFCLGVLVVGAILLSCLATLCGGGWSVVTFAVVSLYNVACWG